MLLNHSQVNNFLNCALFLIKQFPVYTYYRGECNCSKTSFQALCNTVQKFQSSFWGAIFASSKGGISKE
jgi:hypothetical protein